ncbi:hypothetical protein BDW74DRAFT_152747 [Aspergillus multicolor]|uniref:putative proteinase n=1 Tax=Aspergillus multicolor TaxID=41759 RepID=UPI003CCCBC54
MEDRKQRSNIRHVDDSIGRGGPTRRSAPSPTALALAVLAGLTWWLFPISYAKISPNSAAELKTRFSWDQIDPSESLEYHDCFDGFQCARLDVPMDYHREDGKGTRMAIAIARLPAKVPVTDPRYGGAILINPGGPGGSGVAQALEFGRDLQTIADAKVVPTGGDQSSDLYYDIIGFDPRGVNNTTPGFSCFPDLSSQKNWELQAEADGILGSSAESFMRNWQRAIALNPSCSQSISTPLAGGHALGEHTNTPPVARDMLEIIERHGEWRQKQGLEFQGQHHKANDFAAQQSILSRTEWRRGQEKLLYWGRSYGTVLGATFAALFPDRVERMVLDAVVDADKYYSGVGPEPVADADAIFDKFSLYCNAIGAECPFYAEGGPAAIKEMYKELENALYNSSIAVPPSETRGPEVVTWSDLKVVLRIAIYQPLVGFTYLAGIAGDLLKGDGSALADFKIGRHSPSCPSNECLIAGPWSSECEAPGQNELYSTSAILCSDAEYMQSTDEHDFKRHWRGLQELSSMIGDYWAHTRLNCAGWSVKPKWKMQVPVSGNTSFPMLFVNNILDPVTPLASAKKMSGAFPGSVLLQQDSEGHSTLAAPSTCVDQSIRKYFQKGELPAPGTLCDADLKPMLGAPNKLEEPRSLDETASWQARLDEAPMIRVPFPL